ncbi:DNA methyltransferase [Maridesulfovibrio frigidus]|uniref:DNA methyltransferase n=1 Tax=Maridesulfovibrio frigidus TaxID=340956 RepID=UPI0004E1EBEE|nr:DNA methyltransferase [Maridesulfovibrio frigidus]
MLISRNEIRTRALAFSKEWAEESSENAEAKSFWDAFFNIFGIKRRTLATFEEPVKKLGQKQGFIDLFWKGKLLVEHKSRGRNLDKAFTQALDYFPGIKTEEHPQYVLVSDFAKFRLYDLENDEQFDFKISELHNKIELFNFISGYTTHKVREEDPVNIKAATLMGDLHDQLKEAGYDGHPLEVLLVRLLFCLFAEDTSIFEPVQFQDYIEQRTAEDGSDLGAHLSLLFQVLNTPTSKRQKTLDEQLDAFEYINGKLFEEVLPISSFDSSMRESLLECCNLNWSLISPAVFGSLFQSIMDKAERRNLGAHYTSEQNILKVIGPLFLNGLRSEFKKAGKNKKKLTAFQNKLRTLTFLDPACGCGNFLIIAYRELRELELEVLIALQGGKAHQLQLDIKNLIKVNVDQFYGIELEDFPAQIAQVALWLMDHQMNQKVSIKFGLNFARIPLRSKATIICGNALHVDWSDLIPIKKLNFILGNPPFIGSKYMDKGQKEDVSPYFSHIKNGGILDYVSAWYIRAASYIKDTNIMCAFVSTNSICQGEQVGVLWKWMLKNGMKIFFAHRTFQWTNEASGKAAVHCVIVGFSEKEVTNKLLFEYDDIKGDPHSKKAKNINPYLVDASDVFLDNRKKPICHVPRIGIGNKPIDGGHYLFTPEERDSFIKIEPKSEQLFKRWLGAKEFLNGYERWCLWLGDCPPNELRKLPECLKRVNSVKNFRLASKSSPTQKIAETPTHFHVENMPKSNYLVVPKVSSERRRYIPIGFETPSTLVSDLVFIIGDATLYHFGILSSMMHNDWMRSVAGRLKSDYRYSAGIVYNNYPWPKKPTKKQIDNIKKTAQSVLDTRAKHSSSSLADLYDPLAMPSVLIKAHRKLDSAVDAAYGRKFNNDAQRISYLFDLLNKYLNTGN